MKLTERQAEIYGFVRDFIRANKYPPTRKQIADAFGFASPNAAQEHLLAIEKKGWLRIIGHKMSRGLTLVPHGGRCGSIYETWEPDEPGPTHQYE